MNSRFSARFMALCLSALCPSTAYSAVAAAPAGKPKKPKKPKAPAKSERAVSDSTWSAMVDRQIIVVSGGREIRGRLAGHDADNVTIIESNGAISDLSKDSVSEVRADMNPKQEETQDPAPRKESERARMEAEADDEDGPKGSFRRRGAFMLLSPGIVAFPFGAPLFYRWGLSVGGMIPGEASNFAGAYSFTFEHFVDKDTVTETYYDPYDPYYGSTELTADVWTHMVRALAEFRLGKSNKRVFGYALLGVGGAILRVTAQSSGIKATSNVFGLSAPVGGGIQGLIGERFVLGFEPRVVLDFFFGEGIAAMFDARVVLGAKF